MKQKINSVSKLFHQWIGLIAGWFLFFIIITGSLSIFDKEITRWMQPELGLQKPSYAVSEIGLQRAYTLWSDNKNIRKNFISLPTERDPYLRTLHAQDNLLQGNVIDTVQGTIIPTRQTGGGYFIDSLHNNLFIGRYIGGAIIAIIAIAFICTIITGILIHYAHLVKSLFKIQPYAGPQKFKLDLHTAIGLFFLPFLLIMGVSGLLFVAPRYLPAPAPTTHQQQKPSDLSHHGHNQPEHSIRLYAMLEQATHHFSAMPETINITNKDIRFVENDNKNIAFLKNYIAFDKKTEQISSISKPPTGLSMLQRILFGIHKTRAGGLFIRSIFFITGILSAIFIGCGLLYYSGKKQSQILTCPILYKRLFYRIIRGINIAVIMGSFISLTSLFWINRLLPSQINNRITWETNLYFGVLSCIFIYTITTSLFTKHMQFVWRALLLLLSILCLGLPFIDAITSFNYIKTSIINDNYLYITFDIIAFIGGLLSLYLYRYIVVKGS